MNLQTSDADVSLIEAGMGAASSVAEPKRREESSRACRICLEGHPPLISPCKCTGSHGFVHEDCLRTWVNTTANAEARTVCQLCNTPYAMRRVRAASNAHLRCSFSQLGNNCMFVLLYVPLITAMLIIGVSMLISFFVHVGLCNTHVVSDAGAMVRCVDDPLIMTGSVYLLGSLVAAMIMMTQSCYVAIIYGFKQWCIVLCQNNAVTSIMPLLILSSFVMSYVFDDPLLQATALYLIVISVFHKLLWYLYADGYDDWPRRMIDSRYHIRFHNLNGSNGGDSGSAGGERVDAEERWGEENNNESEAKETSTSDRDDSEDSHLELDGSNVEAEFSNL